MGRSKIVEVDCEVEHSTDKAYLVSTGTTKEPVWVPKSVVDDYSFDTVNGAEVITSIFIPEFIAIEKGLI